MSVGTFIAVCLVTIGICFIRSSTGNEAIHYFLLCLGTVSLLFGIKEWARLLRAEVLFKATQGLPLNGGEISFPVPTCGYELWLFCDVPFSRYHGFLTISAGTDQDHRISLPRRRVWSGSVRSDFRPLVWRSPTCGSHAQLQQGQIRFCLSPTFAHTIFSSRFPTNVVESVSIVVMGRKGRHSH
jgi:hypothetical protein